MVSTSVLVEMSKQQTGLRIDRVLFKQFQQLCALEKLRPGEAVESLVRLAVDSGTLADLHAKVAKRGGKGGVLDEALFKSRLSRLKTCLEAERRYWKETGEGIDEPESEEFVKELVEIGKRSVSEELVKEFETVLAEADKLYDEIERDTMEDGISRRKEIIAIR
jgi:hypothetical protein